MGFDHSLRVGDELPVLAVNRDSKDHVFELQYDSHLCSRFVLPCDHLNILNVLFKILKVCSSDLFFFSVVFDWIQLLAIGLYAHCPTESKDFVVQKLLNSFVFIEQVQVLCAGSVEFLEHALVNWNSVTWQPWVSSEGHKSNLFFVLH